MGWKYYPIPTILICLFFCWSSNFVEKVVLNESRRRGWHLVSPTLYIIIVYRVNLNKLSRNFVEAIRTTTTNCRVRFIDLYLVFPTNFRIVFLAHTNTNFTRTVLCYYHRAWVTCANTSRLAIEVCFDIGQWASACVPRSVVIRG